MSRRKGPPKELRLADKSVARATRTDRQAPDGLVTFSEVAGCISKVRFLSRAQAKDKAKQHNRAVKPYRCPYCGWFHLTSKGG